MLTVSDLYIAFMIFIIIIYQLYEADLLKYPYQTYGQECIMLTVIMLLNLWLTLFISTYNVSLFTSSDSCLLNCPEMLKPMLSTRGENYYSPFGESDHKDKLHQCLLSTWGGSHIFMYALITFICPRLWWIVLLIGICWEFYESHALGCQDFIDIIWDSIGIFCGYTLAKKWKYSSVYKKPPNTPKKEPNVPDENQSTHSEPYQSSYAQTMKKRSAPI